MYYEFSILLFFSFHHFISHAIRTIGIGISLSLGFSDPSVQRTVLFAISEMKIKVANIVALTFHVFQKQRDTPSNYRLTDLHSLFSVCLLFPIFPVYPHYARFTFTPDYLVSRQKQQFEQSISFSSYYLCHRHDYLSVFKFRTDIVFLKHCTKKGRKRKKLMFTL